MHGVKQHKLAEDQELKEILKTCRQNKIEWLQERKKRIDAMKE